MGARRPAQVPHRCRASEAILARLSTQWIGHDQRAGFNIHLVGALNCLTRPRRVEAQTVIVQQILPRRAAAKMHGPYASRQRMGESLANTVGQGASRSNWQQER